MTIPPGMPDPVPWSRLVAPGRPRLPGPPQIPPLLEPAPVRYPAAFCAPGTEAIAALTLRAKGEHVEDIRASRMLEGRTEVIVVTEPPELLPTPASFCIELRAAAPDVLGFTWEEKLRIRAGVAHTMPLSSIAMIP